MLIWLQIEPGVAGVLLVYSQHLYAFQYMGTIPHLKQYDSTNQIAYFLVRTFVETESKLSSVERLSFFYRGIPTEPAITATAPVHLREDWPTAGKVSVKKVWSCFNLDKILFSSRTILLQMSASYSIGGKNVISNLSFDIGGGEKVGVVGRTGAGKVSAILSSYDTLPSTFIYYYRSLITVVLFYLAFFIFCRSRR